VVTAPTVVTVEWVSHERRTDELEGVEYAVVQRDEHDNQWVHLPGTDEERAMSLLDFGRRVAAGEGAQWVQPGAWVPGVVDDFADVVEDGNGLVRNRHAQRHLKRQRAGVAA
jgi:hypothetical protein